jgi:basic membrane protein A and related proteins
MENTEQAVPMSIARVQSEFAGWLDTVVEDAVSPSDCPAVIDNLADKDGCDIVFSCDWSFADQFAQGARRHPQVKFVSAAFELPPGRDTNLSAYSMDLYWHSYLQGLVAGSLSESGKIGFLSGPYLAGQDLAELNLFALGVKAANPKAAVFASFLERHSWETPSEMLSAATLALVSKGCDFVGGYDVSVEAIDSASKLGKRVRTFHLDMSYAYKPNVIVSGPLRDFSIFFRPPLLALRDGAWKREMVNSKSSMKFGGGGTPFNPDFMPELQSKRVKTPDMGEVALLDLLEKRSEQMISGRFEPLTGPIKDQRGKLRLAAGVRGEWDFITRMDWLLDNVKGTIPAK